jgi:hypothetical protein
LVLFHYVYPAKADYIPRPIWDDLLRHLGCELDHPRKDAPFRGSLLDEKMFAIDVHEWGMENLLEHSREQREPKITALPSTDTSHAMATDETEVE